MLLNVSDTLCRPQKCTYNVWPMVFSPSRRHSDSHGSIQPCKRTEDASILFLDQAAMGINRDLATD